MYALARVMYSMSHKTIQCAVNGDTSRVKTDLDTRQILPHPISLSECSVVLIRGLSYGAIHDLRARFLRSNRGLSCHSLKDDYPRSVVICEFLAVE